MRKFGNRRHAGGMESAWANIRKMEAEQNPLCVCGKPMKQHDTERLGHDYEPPGYQYKDPDADWSRR